MGIRSNRTISVTASGIFDIEDLIKEFRHAYPDGNSGDYKLEARITVHKATDQRETDEVTFHITPKPKPREAQPDPRGPNA